MLTELVWLGLVERKRYVYLLFTHSGSSQIGFAENHTRQPKYHSQILKLQIWEVSFNHGKTIKQQ